MRKHRLDGLILVLTLVLMAIGLIVIYAIGPAVRASLFGGIFERNKGGLNDLFFKQLVSVMVALLALLSGYFFPYEWLKKYAKQFFILTIMLSLVLAVAGMMGLSLVKCENGGCRWYNLGVFSFQPAEALKLGLTIYLGYFLNLERERGTLGKGKRFWVRLGIILLGPLILTVGAQKDLGTGAVLVGIALAALWVSGISLKKFGLILLIMTGLVGLSILLSPHRMKRLATFSGADGANYYHINNAKMAIGSGGWFGVGMGNSVQATGYLPESINDSVFAIMGETLGFLKLTIVMMIFMVLLLRLLRVADGLDGDKKIVVAGVFAWIAVHVVANTTSMLGLLPMTGITLPLLSYGGTSMMFVAGGIGLCLQLSCYTRREEKYEDTSSRRGVRRTYHASRSRYSSGTK